jgi:hypothetical protein
MSIIDVSPTRLNRVCMSGSPCRGYVRMRRSQSFVGNMGINFGRNDARTAKQPLNEPDRRIGLGRREGTGVRRRQGAHERLAMTSRTNAASAVFPPEG